MQNLTQPTLLLKPFADQGDKNTIPNVNTDASEPQRADLTYGFPTITSLPPDQGGLPPERKDFNGLGYLTTTYDFFYQAGGTFTFNQTISDAIGGYPLNARLWHTDSDGISMILRSTIQNNTNNFLTDSSVIGQIGDTSKPWVIESFMGIKGQYDLLDFKWSDHILNDVSWLRADTFSWQSGDVYVAVYNHLVADMVGISPVWETVGSYQVAVYNCADGHKVCTPDQETNIQNIYNESGVAWYYILDTANQRFKLPRINPAREELIQTIRAKGNGMALGLTNGSSNAGLGSQGEFINVDLGMLKPVAGLYGSSTSASGNYREKTYGAWGITKDSTKSGIISDMADSTSVYKGKKYLYFYVGNFTQSATEQTAGLNSELFNGKVDLDAANLSDAGKSLIAGLGMPSDTYDDITIGATNTYYTAPADGYFTIESDVVNKTANYMGYLKNETTGGRVPLGANGYFYGGGIVPVKKGQRVFLVYNSNVTINNFKFVYAQGSESEA